MAKYRPNVAGIFQRKNGKIWIGERADFAGSWTFPQGGVDAGEKRKAAFYREMNEEVGLKKSEIEILEKRDGYRYKFSGGHLKFGKYHGQKQTYYLCRVLPKKINIHTKKPEFQSGQWIEPGDFRLEWLPRYKHGVYKAVMADFFGVKVKLRKKAKPAKK